MTAAERIINKYVSDDEGHYIGVVTEVLLKYCQHCGENEQMHAKGHCLFDSGSTFEAWSRRPHGLELFIDETINKIARGEL